MNSVASVRTAPQAWYTDLTPTHFRILAASFLGWIFDGYETYALVVALPFALRALLPPEQLKSAPIWAGTAISVTLLGWGFGGLIGGVLADYVGRKRMMIIAVLAYSLMTGLSAFSFNWISFAILRFMVGLAVGSEWATGSSMMAELWPHNARRKSAR